MSDTEKTKARIVRRIAALFKLGGNNASEAEVLAAVGKAKVLMVEHSVSMHDIDTHAGKEQAKRIRVTVEENPGYTRKGNFAKYDHPIMQATRHICTCQVYIRTLGYRDSGMQQQVVFYGEAVDAAVAGELYLIMLKSLRRFTREVMGKGWSKRHTDYALGFGIRVAERAREQARVSDPRVAKTAALVLVSKTDAIAQYRAALRLGRARQVNRPLGPDGLQGYADGHRMSLGRSGLRGDGE
jgi:hypothetical protein